MRKPRPKVRVDRACATCGQPVPTGTDSCPFCGAGAPAEGEGIAEAAAEEPAGAKLAAADVGAVVAAADGAAADDGEAAPEDETAAGGEAEVADEAGAAAEVTGTVGGLRERLLSQLSAARASGRLRIAGIVVAAVLAVAFIVFVAVSWLGDRRLADEAARAQTAATVQATASTGAQTASTVVRFASTLEGVGGGDIVYDAGWLIWSDATGVLALDANGLSSSEPATDDAIATLAQGEASCLNAYEGDLYYLASDGLFVIRDFADDEATLAGNVTSEAATSEAITSDAATSDAAAGAASSSAAVSAPTAPELVLAPDEGCSFDNLLVRRGVAFFTRTDGEGAVSVCALSLVEDGAALAELGSFEAPSDAALFYDGTAGTLAAFVSRDAAWELVSWAVADASELSGASAVSLMQGEGEVMAVCFDGSRLYLSVTGQDGALRCSAVDATGNFTDYPDLADVVALAQGEEATLAVTRSGGVAYIDAESGLSHNITQGASEALSSMQIAGARLAVQEGVGWLVADDGSVACVELAEGGVGRLVATKGGQGQ